MQALFFLLGPGSWALLKQPLRRTLLLLPCVHISASSFFDFSATGLDRRALHAPADAADVAVQFVFENFINKRLPVSGAEDEVDVITYKGLLHSSRHF